MGVRTTVIPVFAWILSYNVKIGGVMFGLFRKKARAAPGGALPEGALPFPIIKSLPRVSMILGADSEDASLVVSSLALAGVAHVSLNPSHLIERAVYDIFGAKSIDDDVDIVTGVSTRQMYDAIEAAITPEVLASQLTNIANRVSVPLLLWGVTAPEQIEWAINQGVPILSRPENGLGTDFIEYNSIEELVAHLEKMP